MLGSRCACVRVCPPSYPPPPPSLPTPTRAPPPEARPERRIAIVAHWGVFYALLGGKSLRNCELHQCTELLADPLAPPG